MKTSSLKIIFSVAILAAILTGVCVPQNSSVQTPPPDANVPSDTSASLPSDISPDSPLAQAIRLADSGVDQAVIMSYVNNSASPFNLTPDDIIYLKDIGLPNDIVNAMMQRDQQLGATANPPAANPAGTTEVATEQPAVVTQNYFYDTLSPYGGWVNVEGYGLCWRPTVVAYDSGWQPYCNHGHWVYTDAGWYWYSDYSWGATAFHYGRWFHHARFGWCWYPDTVWAPSWVCWRYSNDYCGWAPLPPRCVYREGVGIVFNGAVVSAGFDFGIGVNFFTFVPTRNFCDRHPDRFRVHRDQAATIFNRTTVINNFNFDGHNRTIINNGIQPERISAVSKTKIPRLAIHEATSAGAHGERVSGNSIAVNRPHFSGDPVAPLHQGVVPPTHSIILKGNGNNSAVHTETTRHEAPQNNFSQPNRQLNQNPNPQQIQHNQQQGQQQIQRQKNISPPAQNMEPAFRPPSQPVVQTPGTRHDYGNRVMSPKEQQVQQQSPNVTPRHSQEQENANLPEHSQPAPVQSAPQQSSDKSDKQSGQGGQNGQDKNQNGAQHH